MESFWKNGNRSAKKRRKSNGKSIEIVGATEHNLKNVNVKFPLGVFNCVTGVSGSGKSTLVNEVLYNYLARELYGSNVKPGKCEKIKGIENIDKIINIDPIDYFIVVCVFINLYINAIGYINRCFSLFFSEDYSSKYWQCT